MYPAKLMTVCVYLCPAPLPIERPYGNRTAIPYGQSCPNEKVIEINGNA